MARPFTVEVPLDVSPPRAWRALTDTSEVAQWFGWDAETLADEIQYIFVDHSTRDPERMRMDSDGMDQFVEIVPSGPNSTVRAVQSGDEHDADEYDSMKSGWIQFFHQLKRYVEEHTGDARRTIFLRGVGNARSISSAFEERLPGKTWFADSFTRVVATPDYGPGLAVLNVAPGSGLDQRGDANLTLSTWGLSDREFEELAKQWLEWWRTLADESELVTGRA